MNRPVPRPSQTTLPSTAGVPVFGVLRPPGNSSFSSVFPAPTQSIDLQRFTIRIHCFSGPEAHQLFGPSMWSVL